MAELQDYSTTAGNNNSASPAGMPENMAPSGVNDAWREMAARIARERDDTQGVTATGGSSSAYTLAAVRDTAAAYTGEMFVFRANHTNDGATTINITPNGGSARGAVAVQLAGAALTGGEIISGGVYTVVYDGTQFQLVDPAPQNLATTASPLFAGISIGPAAQLFQAFTYQLNNNGGTLRHRFGPPTLPGVAGNFHAKISGATSSYNNTPTGTDGSTAFVAGAKISSANTNVFILDTADQTQGEDDFLFLAHWSPEHGNDTILLRGRLTSRDVNGTTRTRLELQHYDNAGSTYALNTTNISSGESVVFNVWCYLL